MDKKDDKERPLTSMSPEERENAWDDVYIKEEGIILEFDFQTNTGKIKSTTDYGIYNIDTRELIRTKIELHPGDKVLFAPVEDPDGNDYARIIKIIKLKT